MGVYRLGDVRQSSRREDANRDRGGYVPGQVRRFSIAALAYSVELASRAPVEITDGNFLEFHRHQMLQEDPSIDPASIQSVEVSMAGARILFPHPKEPLLGSTYRAPVEAVEEFLVEGVRIVRMRIGPLADEEHTVSMWLYAGPPALGGYEPRVGDEIEGFAWIQGVPIREA